MRLPLPALVFVLACLLSLPVAAQDLQPRYPGEIITVARSYGSANFGDPDGDGRPTINGEIDGVRYGILFYGCDNPAGCESVQFFASFESQNNTLDFVNQWNRDKRFATAYLAEDGDVVLAFSANVDFGVTRQNFTDTFDIWTILLEQFNDRIFNTGAEAPPVPAQPSK